ncbi:MAG: TonB-dependent receptor [Pseudomonadota bacterium]
MTRVNGRKFDRSMLVGVASMFAMMAAAPASFAQDNARAKQQNVVLQAGPMGDALFAITDTFDVNILADQTLTRGKNAPALSGTMTADEALMRILDGSNLAFTRTSNGAYIIELKETAVRQNSDDRSSEASDTIIVRGTKLEQSLQDLEVSVEFFSPERLDREQITQLDDLLSKIPNVNTSGGQDSNFRIRGIGRSGSGGAGQGVTSNIYVDGAPLTSLNLNRGPASLWDVQQIEVLRGPQSSVQGRNALAGGIFIQTADPTFKPEGKFRATYATADTYQVSGALSGPIIDGVLAGRIAVDFQGSDGFITNENLGGIDFNVTESMLVRGKLLLQPEGLPKFSTKLTVDYNESEVFGEDNTTVRAPVENISDPDFASFDPKDFETFGDPRNNDNDGIRIVSETAYDFTDTITARAIITHEDYSTLRTFGDENDISRFGTFVANQFDDTIFSAEARLEFDFGNVRGLVGAYYFNEERKGDRRSEGLFDDTARGIAGPFASFVTVNPADSVIGFRTGETFDTDNYAFFGQVDWQFAPKWTLGLGARYDVEEFQEKDRFDEGSIDPDTCLVTAPAILLGAPGAPPTSLLTVPCQITVDGFFGGDNPPATAADFEAFLPRASLTYDFNDNTSVFVSASRGYRAGGAFVAIEENTETLGFVEVVGQYDPEYLDTFEIGMRNILLEGRLLLNANAFYSKYTDQQVLVDNFDPNTPADDSIVNAGESTLYGLEFIADYDITDNAGAFLTVGLLETEYDDFPFAVDSDGNPTNPDDPQFANLEGDSFSGSPHLTFTVGGDWEGNSGLFGNVSFTYIQSAQTGTPNINNSDLREALSALGSDPDLARDFEETSEDRTDLTARLGWRSDNIQAFVFATNLLDSDGFTSRNFGNIGRQTGELSLNDPTFSIQQPRVIGVGVDMSF